ncbi:M14 family metallopeptidase [Kushneria sp. AK178]
MQHRIHELMSAVPGTATQLHSFHYGPPDSEHSIYIQSSLHADELPGMLVAWKLKQRMAELEAAGLLHARVCIVPVANPIGLTQQLMDVPLGRYELETLKNFNRHYPDMTADIAEGLDAALGESENDNARIIRTRFLAALDARTPANTLESLQLTLQRLACQADYVLDLHCDFNAVEHLYTTPAAWPTFEPLARYFGSRASMLATDSGGQSFDECFTLVWEQLREHLGDRFPIGYGTQSITLELRGQDDVDHGLADHDSNAIVHWMMQLGLAHGEPPELPALLFPPTPLSAMEFLTAPEGGLLVFHVAAGDRVANGQLVAEVIDPIRDVAHEVRATQDGMIYARSQRRMATAGMIVADLAGHDSRRSGYLLAP